MPVQTGLQIEACLGMPAARRARNAANLPYCLSGSGDIIRGDEEPGEAIHDNLTKAASSIGHNRSAGGLSLSGDEAEGLLPFGRTQHDRSASHDLPENSPRYGRVNRDPRLAAPGVDVSFRVREVIRVAIEIDVHTGGPGDLENLCHPLLRTEPAREDRAGPC